MENGFVRKASRTKVNDRDYVLHFLARGSIARDWQLLSLQIVGKGSDGSVDHVIVHGISEA